MRTFINYTGKRFGKFVVVSRETARKRGKATYWLCECDCGAKKVVNISNLVTGGTKSCGCHKRAMNGETRRGENNPGWKGGKSKRSDGYVVFNAGPNKGRPEHQVVMEAKIGRRLFPDETVHHKNGVRDDNRIENLELWASNHPSGSRVCDLVRWAKELLQRYEKIH